MSESESDSNRKKQEVNPPYKAIIVTEDRLLKETICSKNQSIRQTVRHQSKHRTAENGSLTREEIIRTLLESHVSVQSDLLTTDKRNVISESTAPTALEITRSQEIKELLRPGHFRSVTIYGNEFYDKNRRKQWEDPNDPSILKKRAEACERVLQRSSESLDQMPVLEIAITPIGLTATKTGSSDSPMNEPLPAPLPLQAHTAIEDVNVMTAKNSLSNLCKMPGVNDTSDLSTRIIKRPIRPTSLTRKQKKGMTESLTRAAVPQFMPYPVAGLNLGAFTTPQQPIPVTPFPSSLFMATSNPFLSAANSLTTQPIYPGYGINLANLGQFNLNAVQNMMPRTEVRTSTSFGIATSSSQAVSQSHLTLEQLTALYNSLQANEAALMVNSALAYKQNQLASQSQSDIMKNNNVELQQAIHGLNNFPEADVQMTDQVNETNQVDDDEEKMKIHARAEAIKEIKEENSRSGFISNGEPIIVNLMTEAMLEAKIRAIKKEVAENSEEKPPLTASLRVLLEGTPSLPDNQKSNAEAVKISPTPANSVTPAIQGIAVPTPKMTGIYSGAVQFNMANQVHSAPILAPINNLMDGNALQMPVLSPITTQPSVLQMLAAPTPISTGCLNDMPVLLPNNVEMGSMVTQGLIRNLANSTSTPLIGLNNNTIGYSTLMAPSSHNINVPLLQGSLSPIMNPIALTDQVHNKPLVSALHRETFRLKNQLSPKMAEPYGFRYPGNLPTPNGMEETSSSAGKKKNGGKQKSRSSSSRYNPL